MREADTSADATSTEDAWSGPARPGSQSRLATLWRNSLVGAGLTRALLLPITSVATLAVAHVEITALGRDRFGVLTLLLAFALLFPFADLGIGAAVTNAVATRGTSRSHEQLIGSSLRLLILVSLVIAGLSASLTLTSSWGHITGATANEAPSLNRDMLLVMGLFAAGLPLALGGRILLGLDRYPVFVLIQSSIPFVTLFTVIGFRGSHSMTPFLLAPFAAQDLASFVAFVVAVRMLGLSAPQLSDHVRQRHRARYREIGRSAIPMAVITIALPIALQTDRLVLSHVSSRNNLSEYAIVAMLYLPVWSIISTGGMGLWPKFASLRRGRQLAQRSAYQRMFVAFSVAGALAGLALFALGPLITEQWAGSRGGSALLWGVFAFLLLVQATHLPGAMFLTRPEGLRFQAYCVTAMCVVNLPLSIVLAKAWGAAGPPFASAVTILVFQLVTARWRIMRLEPGSAILA